MRLSACSARALVPHLLDGTSRFDYETEMLIIASRKGFRIAAVPISTVYSDEVSSIHPVRDTIRFFKLMRRYEAGSAVTTAKPRRRKSPMFPPEDLSIRSIVNLSRQTSQASSTP